MKNFILLLVIKVLLVFNCYGEDSPHVNSLNGNLQGIYLKSRSGRNYSAFLGIPYAKPPKRFKLAEPSEKWEGTRNATSYGQRCLQRPFLNYMGNINAFGSEDCLFLNTFSPKLDGKLPVMVFIHGGGFMVGSSSDQGADYFMDENVILVTINYRLGALGFLSTGDGFVEPNLGLKDQNLALQWIQHNIHLFGGDPGKVCIFGISAGSASAHYQVLSPASKGLFQQAILQSGTALHGWSFAEDPRSHAFALGKAVGCSSAETSEELVHCLDKKTSDEIVNANLIEWVADPFAPFRPSLDIPGGSKQMFLPDTPINILKSGDFNKVPLIVTITEDEGILLHAYTVNASEILRKQMNENYEHVLPITLLYKYQNYSVDEQKHISNEIKKFYFGDKEIGGDTFQQLTNMYSDAYFIHGVERALAIHSKYNTVYNGIFAYQGQHSFITILFGEKNPIGFSHGDDLIYFFPFGSNTPFGVPAFPPHSKDEMVSKYFVNMWANFATTGDPGLKFSTISWTPLRESNTEVDNGTTWMNIDFPPTYVHNPFGKRVQFWDTILTKGA